MDLHRDKERLRHQRQVKLLDDVMQIVPRPLNNSASKVRQLRHLVLYYHFMKKVHAEISKGHSSIIKGCKKSPMKTTGKSARKSLTVHCANKKKLPRANIVFLQADQSKSNKVENVFDELNVEENDVFPKSPFVEKMEYKVPEIVVNNETDDSNAVFDHNPCLADGNIMPVHSNGSISSDEFSLHSDIASEDNSNTGKENHSPIKTSLVINNSNDHIDMQSKRKIPETITNINLTPCKCKETDFQNILQDYSNNSTLKGTTVSDTISENFCVADVNYQNQDSNYVFKIHPYENVSGYPISLSSSDVILARHNLNCKPLYSFDSPQLLSVPSFSENLSDNCSSSTLTDNLNIDVENFSDSSNDGKMKTDNTNDENTNNGFDSPKALVYEFPHGSLMNYDDYFPFISSSYNCLENYDEQSEISYRPMNYLPHFDTVAPNSASFVENPTVIQCFEPIHSIQDRFVEPRFISDNVTFYSPTYIENFPPERSTLLNSKLEIKSDPDTQEVFFEKSMPSRLFEEEVSYPLAQYINDY